MPTNDMKAASRFMKVQLARERKSKNQSYDRIATATWSGSPWRSSVSSLTTAKAAQASQPEQCAPKQPMATRTSAQFQIAIAVLVRLRKTVIPSTVEGMAGEDGYRQLDGGRTEHTFVWTDPKTGLQVRLTAVDYAGSHVVEWTEYFKNDGKVDTPILEDVQPLDISVPLTGSGIPMILYSNGCGGMDTYALQKHPLNQLDSLRLSNEGGGKTVHDDTVF